VAAWLDALLERMLQVPELLLLLILAAAAFFENWIPPVPADVIIVFGGFLVGQGASRLWLVFLVVWLFNVAGALGVFLVGRTYGPGFFSGRLGSFLLRPQQLTSLAAFYHRFGFGVIFFGRFLPVFRSVVPVFAGVTHLGLIRTTLPIAAASALWYGMLLYLASAAGQNWSTILGFLDRSGRWLLVPAAVIAGAVVTWWWRSRGEHPAS